ncbi:hypothetical protein K435DRAFT_729039 [Dendrothele bispora CBS 962.96]|uniref:Thioesterase/thiol ester dehydrase-isomerase n=1 Tax=Dendrothele bispora (strain CBS 962.96) TaxID=1314807 RepID=A0A4V4HE28_DENBC|nr:hypothetical protein K435DRAFT_729039 [Dendrothele bispora CBS 962.96]
MLANSWRNIPLRSARGVRNTRLYSAQINHQSLDEWIAEPKHLVLTDTIHPERLSDLYITLPTRDGIRKPFSEPLKSQPLGYGHHIAFFHFLTPESELRSDGTDGEFCPPEPFSRRMWASGKMTWDPKNPMLIGEKANAIWSVDSIEKKGFEKGRPMLFVNKKIEFTMAGANNPSFVEERVHVYLPGDVHGNNRVNREVKDIPSSSDFVYEFTPSLTTLFRFSALMWNAHHIHLDKDYSVVKEGYPERLVHGPLTSLMLLEAVVDHKPNAQIESFDYRARNPLIVGRKLTVHGKWQNEKTVAVWCVDEDGVVGMTGNITLV